MNDYNQKLMENQFQQADEALKQHAQHIQNSHLTDLFKADPKRFSHLSLQFDQLKLDLSKQRVDENIVNALVGLAESRQLSSWVKRLFSDEAINYTEQRAAMHWALRLNEDDTEHPLLAQKVQTQLQRMYAMVDKIHSGQFRGATGEVIQDVVNIGVGGSDLGPLMVVHALSDCKVATAKPLNMHFVSTMDGSQLGDLLHRLRPESTLFIVSSKSFGTIDTLSNAKTARQWLEQSLGESSAVLKSHFIGVSTRPDKMSDWGIHLDHQLQMWDWVGGRYSLWSCIGLPIALIIGVEGFKDFLAGAHALDVHFQTAPFRQNLPVLMALIGVWNSNYLKIPTHAVLPYDGRLKYFASYLQQLEMESNGKSIRRDGRKTTFDTCPIIWGEVGPNAQHAFYQLLHQGTRTVSTDFIAPILRYHCKHFSYVQNADALIAQHQLALSNCLAQSRLLAFGDQALDPAELEQLPAFKHYVGNQPSTTLLMQELNPYNFGMLLALYEHKVFVQSVIWNINPFDQWGVEKGKQIAEQIQPLIAEQHHDTSALDGSSIGLLEWIKGQ